MREGDSEGSPSFNLVFVILLENSEADLVLGGVSRVMRGNFKTKV